MIFMEVNGHLLDSITNKWDSPTSIHSTLVWQQQHTLQYLCCSWRSLRLKLTVMMMIYCVTFIWMRKSKMCGHAQVTKQRSNCHIVLLKKMRLKSYWRTQSVLVRLGSHLQKLKRSLMKREMMNGGRNRIGLWYGWWSKSKWGSDGAWKIEKQLLSRSQGF